MQCHQCAGKLEGLMTYCPYCGVRQNVDFSVASYRDLGVQSGKVCPRCDDSLVSVELALTTPLVVESCRGCRGTFFDLGELEFLLGEEVTANVWLDLEKLKELEHESDGHRAGLQQREGFRRYLKCPECDQVMNARNFGGRSGVIIDQCGFHGIWFDHGELRRIAEWWHAGGKHFYEKEQQKVASHLRKKVDSPSSYVAGHGMEGNFEEDRWGERGSTSGNVLFGMEALGWLAAIVAEVFTSS